MCVYVNGWCVCLGSAMNKDQWDPEFLKAIPIMKTRSGMQVQSALSGKMNGESN